MQMVERQHELAALEQRLADARDGAGGVVVIDAPLGAGKTRLLSIAAQIALASDMQVLSAHGRELERDYEFAVANQLFESYWPGPGGQDRADGYAVTRSLFRLVRELSSGASDPPRRVPLALLVDDAHLADRQSLRFLGYLAERLERLPVTIIATVLSGARPSEPAAITVLERAAGEAVLAPAPLTPRGVSAIVAARLPQSDDAFRAACAKVTGGNPFLLAELIDHIRLAGIPPSAEAAGELDELAPARVVSAVAACLGAMAPEAASVASAVALFGNGARLHDAARLADLDMLSASLAADALVRHGLFHRATELSFVHPMIRTAVVAAMSPLELSYGHRRAATILAEERAPDEQVAMHLTAAPPQSDPASVEILRRAARDALAEGSDSRGIVFLRRALLERPPPELHPEVLAELAQAEFAAGLPQAIDRLADAIRATDELPRRGALVLAQSQGLCDRGQYREAAEAVGAVIDQLGDRDPVLTDELGAAFIAAAALVPELDHEARARARTLLQRAGNRPTAAQRRAIAQVAAYRSLHGEDRDGVLRLVDLAWDDGELIAQDATDALSWPLLSSALLFVDELERDLEICEAATGRGRSADAVAAIAGHRAWPLYEQGRIGDAASAAEAAFGTEAGDWRTSVRSPAGAIACCHLQAGRLDRADRALSILDRGEVRDSIHLPFLLDVRAQLRLAQLRPSEALEDAAQAGSLAEVDLGNPTPGAIAWRSTAALAHLALGEPGRAVDLAGEELEQARELGITRIVIRDLRVLGLARRGKRGVDTLAEAVDTGDEHPPRLEHVCALIDLGAALRRTNQRGAAREPLLKALELAHDGGATALAGRARAELAATGARSRRLMLSGVHSLTPSERRVADLAARGLTTRHMAETLFVTPKTIEFHLRHIYQKLSIRSRSELAEVLHRKGES